MSEHLYDSAPEPSPFEFIKKTSRRTSVMTTALAPQPMQPVEEENVLPVNRYIAENSVRVSDKVSDVISIALMKLKKHNWREKTKPQGEQLQAIYECQQSLENIYESYFIPHIKAIRANNVFDKRTLICLNRYQIYRKKGILELLQHVDPKLGKDVVIKKQHPVDYNVPVFGEYGYDWEWCQLGGVVGKLNHFINDTKGLIFISPTKVRENSHMYYEKVTNQKSFDLLYEKVKKTSVNYKNMPSADASVDYLFASPHAEIVIPPIPPTQAPLPTYTYKTDSDASYKYKSVMEKFKAASKKLDQI